MPSDAMQDPLSYRFYDYPRPGSIYRLPDIPSLVRGPTYVKMPSGKDVQVPAQMKQDVVVPAQIHEDQKAKIGMQELINMLQGKRGEQAPVGFKTGGRFDRPAQTPLLHPREMPRQASMGDHMLQF